MMMCMHAWSSMASIVYFARTQWIAGTATTRAWTSHARIARWAQIAFRRCSIATCDNREWAEIAHAAVWQAQRACIRLADDRWHCVRVRFHFHHIRSDGDHGRRKWQLQRSRLIQIFYMLTERNEKRVIINDRLVWGADTATFDIYLPFLLWLGGHVGQKKIRFTNTGTLGWRRAHLHHRQSLFRWAGLFNHQLRNDQVLGAVWWA